jgi:STE24 endopeptidase
MGGCEDNARVYASIKYRLSIIDIIYLVGLLAVFAGSGISKILSRGIDGLCPQKFFIFPVYLLIAYTAYAILDFPLNFYRSFILEHQFGLSNEKFGGWFKDQCKAGIIAYIISLVLFLVFYGLVRHYPENWWLFVSAIWIFFSLGLAKLIPIVIIPLFFKYKRLTDESLRQRVMALAHKMGVAILDVFEIDLSRKTTKANAAFVGLGRTRRVLLADTLKDKYTPDEIEAILAHEFAHYRLKHLWKLIAVNSLVTVATFFLIFKSSGYFLKVLGIPSLGDISAFPLVLLYFVVFAAITQPFENFVSRALERNADVMALRVTGRSDAFISMMEKLAKQNLADRNPSRPAKIFFFDHPPIDERIALARSIEIEK